MARRIILALIAVALSLAASGCGRPSGPPEVSVAQPPSSKPQVIDTPVAGLEDMSDEQKLAQLNAGFNTEYPLVKGEVVEAGAQSGTEFTYVVRVKAPSSQVEAWHRQVFQSRAFVLRSEAPAENGALALTYFRAGVVYTVTITPVGEQQTIVRGIVRR